MYFVLLSVIPEKAGIHKNQHGLRFRRDDVSAKSLIKQ